MLISLNCVTGGMGNDRDNNLSHPYPVPGTVNIGERRLKHFLSLGDCTKRQLSQRSSEVVRIIRDIILSTIPQQNEYKRVFTLNIHPGLALQASSSA
jgi:hypothetical protein